MEWNNIKQPGVKTESEPVNLLINNGEDEIALNTVKLEAKLVDAHIPQEKIKTALHTIKQFEVEVRLANNDGKHIGSTDLQEAVTEELLKVLEDTFNHDELRTIVGETSIRYVSNETGIKWKNSK